MCSFRRLLPFVSHYRRAYVLGLACVVITTAIQLMAPWVLKFAIDDLNAGVTRPKLASYAGMLLGIACAGGVFRFLMRRILIGASRDIEYDLRRAFFTHLQRMPLEYYQSGRTGDLMSRATNDLNAVRMMVGPSVMYSASTMLTFVVAILLMLSIDARLTLIALAPLPLVSISVRYFGSEIHRRFETIQEQLSTLSAVVQESLAGVRVVRAYRQEPREIERFRDANLEYLRRNRGLITLQGMFYPSMTLLLGFGSLLVLWQGSRAVVAGRITLGEFVAFNAYLVMLSWPMIAFGWVTNILQRGMASWKRLLEVLDTAPAVADRMVSDAGRALTIAGAIEFRDLVFRYPGTERVVLDHVSLRIAAGQTVAFVGSTGSGKSTLISLLPRLYDPPRGTVFVDGVDVLDIPLDLLRRSIGFVPQEPFLFSDTIGENIGFGVPDLAAGAPRVREAAATARLDVDVDAFPKGLDTLVGERGITLSGGQKQRTALARALLIDPAILILDDALSAVDTYTEEAILTRLRGVMRSRTALIVAHRVSTVRDADVIVVLGAGRIIERGTHDELVRARGVYAELFRKQQLEEELAEA
ncbi:MAG TPA: ABC transporter ATP-binding protein [Vicinamibacterales bacterium]|nr:ABC transporter ATP-binding protein [Vicinamibacterales bacterium]